jgi:hypothetical protein
MAASPSQAGGEGRSRSVLTLSLMQASLRREARPALAFRLCAHGSEARRSIPLSPLQHERLDGGHVN